DEAVRPIPALDNVQRFVDLLPKRLRGQVAAEEHGLLHLSELQERLVRRVLEVVAREAAKNRFRLGGPKAQCRGVLHHLVVLPRNEVPADGPRENRLEVWIVSGTPRLNAVELFPRDPLQPWEELKAEQVAERERDIALTVGVDVVLLDRHLRT